MADGSGRWGCLLVLLGGLRGEVGGGELRGGAWGVLCVCICMCLSLVGLPYKGALGDSCIRLVDSLYLLSIIRNAKCTKPDGAVKWDG